MCSLDINAVVFVVLLLLDERTAGSATVDNGKVVLSPSAFRAVTGDFAVLSSTVDGTVSLSFCDDTVSAGVGGAESVVDVANCCEVELTSCGRSMMSSTDVFVAFL